jgi:hypothetical protein
VRLEGRAAGGPGAWLAGRRARSRAAAGGRAAGRARRRRAAPLPPPPPTRPRRRRRHLFSAPPRPSTEGSRRKPPIYKVMLHNDNYNRREYVVKVLIKVVDAFTVRGVFKGALSPRAACAGPGRAADPRPPGGGSPLRPLAAQARLPANPASP